MPTPKSAPLAKAKKAAKKRAAPTRTRDSVDTMRAATVAQHQADHPREERAAPPSSERFEVDLQIRHAEYVKKCAIAWSSDKRTITPGEAIQIMVRQYRAQDENRAAIEGRGGATGRAGTFDAIDGKFR